MLSSDKNVATIAKMAEIVRHYLGLQGEYLKLDVIEKLVRLLTFAALTLLFLLFLIAVLMYCSFAVAFWLSAYVGYAAAFFIVGAVHLVLFILFLVFRKPLFEKPLVHFLTSLLLGK